MSLKTGAKTAISFSKTKKKKENIRRKEKKKDCIGSRWPEGRKCWWSFSFQSYKEIRCILDLFKCLRGVFHPPYTLSLCIFGQGYKKMMFLLAFGGYLKIWIIITIFKICAWELLSVCYSLKWLHFYHITKSTFHYADLLTVDDVAQNVLCNSNRFKNKLARPLACLSLRPIAVQA